MRLPIGLGAELGRTAARRDDGRFQGFARPIGHGPRDGVMAVGATQHGQGALPVMRRVGVQPQPAVTGAVVTGDRVPDARQFPAQGAQGCLEPGRGEMTIHLYRDRRSSLGQQVGGGQSGDTDHRRGQVADRKAGGETAATLNLQG